MQVAIHQFECVLPVTGCDRAEGYIGASPFVTAGHGTVALAVQMHGQHRTDMEQKFLLHWLVPRKVNKSADSGTSHNSANATSLAF